MKFALGVIFVLLSLSGCSSNTGANQTIQAPANASRQTSVKTTILHLKGTLVMRGTGRTMHLSITDDASHVTYKITNADAFGLLSKQGHIVTLEAKKTKEAIGPGFPAEIKIVRLIR